MLAGYAAGASGARAAARAAASVVVVDAYRASTTIAVLVSKGARVVPVGSLEEAGGADYRIAERGSAKVTGSDFGNSPVEVWGAEIRAGATVALSTTNGTRIVEAARGAPDILAGAFVNAGAVAGCLAANSAPDSRVVVVGCGWEGRRASEDESAAGEILARLREAGARLEWRAERIVELSRGRSERTLRTNSAARRLRRLGYERDLDLCLTLDAVPVCPRLRDGAFVASGGQP